MMNDLFTPLTVGPLELPKRVLMAPLTRACAEPGHVPGLLIAEATPGPEPGSLPLVSAHLDADASD